VDLLDATRTIFGDHTSPNLTLPIGNVDILLQTSDTVSNTIPTAAFVHDDIHPHTTLQGMIANLTIEALNTGYGAGIPLFSEEEILAHAGIAYGGSDTLAATFGDYGDYVVNYVPEPSSFLLAAVGIAVFGVLLATRCFEGRPSRGWIAARMSACVCGLRGSAWLAYQAGRAPESRDEHLVSTARATPVNAQYG